MKLVIVESPAKSKTISKYLGPGYSVKASVGHVRDLPKKNENAVDIAHGFAPHYEIIPEKTKVIADLKAAAKKADEVLLATDPDREGEAIAWHVAEALGLGNSKFQKTSSKQIPNSKFQIPNVKRVVFHEITERAVKEALAHPRDIDERLVRAQEARRVLDRLVGYDLSGLLWKKLRYGLSAGRVQSPALRILVEREREIRAFVPENYWVLTALCATKKGSGMTLVCVEEPKTREEAERILKVGRSGSWIVAEVLETETSRAPRSPFTTSTLQQAASSRLGFSPARTMRTAQQLYEQGHITYMRTDSTTLAEEARSSIGAAVTKKFGERYVTLRQYKTTSKSAQEAHEAIRPTDITRASAGATEEQKRLYALIRARTLASQMAAAELIKTKITARVAVPIEAKDVPAFSAIGSRTKFDGWLAADPASRGEDIELPKVAREEPLTLRSLESEGKQTQPPPRYSEAGLVKELEKRGIGRPSTYASIIKTIQDREYVEKEGRSLKPTAMGDVVSTFLEKNFASYISDTFTSKMEDELDDIARGAREYAKTLADFYTPFSKDVAARQNVPRLTDLGPAPKQFRCPTCGSAMVMKLSRSGTFMSCSRFPECEGARSEHGEEVKPPQETGERCPECGGALVERDGKFGKFVGCGKYPKCKYIKKAASSTQQATSTGVPCPKCGKGEMAERRGKFGLFYGCSNYPACKHAIKAKPTGRICPLCGSLMMEGTKTIPERCSNKECANHRPGGRATGNEQ
ncbi:MAG: type I DNA topoisomerase [bacterium]|nr:type I DNA topoisomerase [bacterium]MDZ4284752.1 type I DNA topoisomerase [Patescibacteria group bacterium]